MKKPLIVLTLFVFLIFPLRGHAEAPLAAIEAQINQVMDVLRDPALKAESAKEAKEKKIWSIINGVFDYTELSKRTLGRDWKRFNADQQREFADLFSKLLGKVYMDRIMGYSDEKVVFKKERTISEGKAEVQSEIITGSNKIPINYRTILKNGKWRVYDVVIEGVSLIQNYRSQFKQILTKNSPAELLETLRKKVGQV